MGNAFTGTVTGLFPLSGFGFPSLFHIFHITVFPDVILEKRERKSEFSITRSIHNAFANQAHPVRIKLIGFHVQFIPDLFDFSAGNMCHG